MGSPGAGEAGGCTRWGSGPGDKSLAGGDGSPRVILSLPLSLTRLLQENGGAWHCVPKGLQPFPPSLPKHFQDGLTVTLVPLSRVLGAPPRMKLVKKQRLHSRVAEKLTFPSGQCKGGAVSEIRVPYPLPKHP